MSGLNIARRSSSFSRHDEVHNLTIHLLSKCSEESKDENDWRINRIRYKVEYKNIIGRNAYLNK